MTWDLVSLKPQPHRRSSDQAYVFINKNVSRSTKANIKALQLRLTISPLPLNYESGNGPKLLHLESAEFNAVADIDERKLIFDITGADAAIPSILQGGGLGSLALTELILWAQKGFGDFSIVPFQVSRSLLNYANAKTIVRRYLENFGFTVKDNQQGGFLVNGRSAAELTIHVNRHKLETLNPHQLCADLMGNSQQQSEAVKEALQQSISLKEQLNHLSAAKQSKLPFLGGLMLGIVAGTAVAAIIFSTH